MSKPANGPAVKVIASCYGCRHCTALPFTGRYGLGHDVYCSHPSAQEGYEVDRYVGERWITPKWCPLLLEAVEAHVEKMRKG